MGVAQSLREKRALAKSHLAIARKDKEDARKKKDKVIDDSKLGDHQIRLEFVDLAISELERVIEEEEASARVEIERVMNFWLEKYSRKDYYADIADDFSFELRKQDGSSVAKSKGERALLSISFISSLIQLAKERSGKDNDFFVQGTVAPFVIDAPFGELDNEYRGAVAEFLPQSTDQLIVLLSSSHWGTMVESGLRPRTGEEYILVSESDIPPEQGKTVDKIEIDGAVHECSRYGMDLQRTVIEAV